MLQRTHFKPLLAVIIGLAVLVSTLSPGTASAFTLLKNAQTQLTATIQEDPAVLLQWTFPDDVRLTGFMVERSLDPLSGYAVIMTTGPSDRVMTDYDVSPGQAYYYRMRAYNKNRYSSYSNIEFAEIAGQGAVDTASPNVTLINPLENEVFSNPQTVTVAADALDDLGVARVDFYCDGVLLQSDTSAPYSAGWTVSEANNGPHSLNAKAYDYANNEGVSVSRNVTVDIAPETVPSPGALELSAANTSVAENAGTVTVVINRVGGSNGVVTVDWRTMGITASYDVDYDSFTWTTLTFADGETSKVEQISIVDDSLVEGDEVFNVLLANPTGGAALGSVTTNAVSIMDNDQAIPVPGSFEFSAASTPVDEGAGIVNITINRVGGSDGVATVDWKTQGITATFTQDYGNFDWTTLTFADGETSKVEQISIVDDSLVEGDEVFNVLLANPTGGAALGSVTTNAVSIMDNDQAIPVPGSFEFSAASTPVDEGAGTVNITINRVGGSDGVATVDWKTQGITATFTQDYGNFDWTTLTFADGETSKVEQISIVDDSLVEGDEVFNVLLANPTGGAALGSVTTNAVSIMDNDQTESDPTSSSVFYGYDPTLGASDNPQAAPYGGIARYVDPINGVNSGSGTISQPWADMEYALTHCSAGDTIYLRGGIHYYDVFINNSVAATQANPVEVRSYPGEWAIIDGSQTSNGNLIRFYNEDWVIFRNFEIRNSDDSRVSAGLAVEGSQDCEFHNLYIHSNHGPGVAGATGTERLKFVNLTVKDNYDASYNGENADGFAFTAGLNHEFYRCVASNNSDDGWDLWSSSGHYFEDCVSHGNGYGSAGDGNGFKLGKVASSTPEAGVGGGLHTLVNCIAVGNNTRGFDENGSTVPNTFRYCISYNSNTNWKIPNAAHVVDHGVSFGGTGDSIGSTAIITDSQGQGFGGYVTDSDFESVDIADMNNTTPGRRFFVPVSSSFWP